MQAGCGEEVCAVHRRSGFDQRMVAAKLRAEVNAFFQIRLAGGEFIANGK